MPGEKTVRWDNATMELILAARTALEQMGMKRPSIRAVLYYVLRLPGWRKSHYDTLCEKLGEWRDSGKIAFGLFADDGAGASYRPLTMEEIQQRIHALENMVMPQLPKDRILYTVFVEHISLVDTIAEWLRWRVPIVSSQGQLRREHMYTAAWGWKKVAEVLGAEHIRCVALTDWDHAGELIYRSHERWLRRMFGISTTRWAITSQQLRAARLPVHEDHQLDGWIAAYGPQRLQRELRRTMGIS